MDLLSSIQSVRDRVHAACMRAGRDPSSVMITAVSKGQRPEAVNAAAAAGLVLFGENKVQEAKAKIPLCSSRLRWHMIGHLQSNKCRDAVTLFEMIQSVDSLSLAEELNKWAEKSARMLPVLLEVNVAKESSKFGLVPEAVLASFLQFNALPRLEVQGLMTIAPWTRDPETVRPIFRRLRELKDGCEQMLGVPLPHVSMGTSGDFEVAIAEGATIIRIGTSLFGPRPKIARTSDEP